VGAEIAAKLDLQENSLLTLFDHPFRIIAILPQTGTIDDSRVFAHLHTVQKISGKGSVVHAIEVVGCCKEIAHGLIAKMTSLLPGAKITTITQLVNTQIKTNQIMRQLSLLFFAIVMLMGIISIANDMYANVRERKKEIGTLLAIGSAKTIIIKIFLIKVLFLGILGGISGYTLGSLLAIILGPVVAHVTVLPELNLLFYSLGVSTTITLLASYLPIRAATQLDPSSMTRET
jgi:putative ABC transport system permease protein